MKLRAISAVAAGAGLVLTVGLLASGPARAQFTGQPQLLNPPTPAATVSGGVNMPQPIEIQALDRDHFVVATREPRLVQNGREGTATQMMVTVVTHYTVAGDRLLPVEHVRTPAGWQPVNVGSR